MSGDQGTENIDFAKKFSKFAFLKIITLVTAPSTLKQGYSFFKYKVSKDQGFSSAGET